MVSGATVSMVQVKLAGVASMLPAASVARTRSVCGPSARADNVCGLVHVAKAAPSSEHSNVASASSAEKVKTGSVSFEGLVGVVSIVVSGAPLSTVHV